MKEPARNLVIQTIFSRRSPKMSIILRMIRQCEIAAAEWPTWGTQLLYIFRGDLHPPGKGAFEDGRLVTKVRDSEEGRGTLSKPPTEDESHLLDGKAVDAVGKGHQGRAFYSFRLIVFTGTCSHSVDPTIR